MCFDRLNTLVASGKFVLHKSINAYTQHLPTKIDDGNQQQSLLGGLHCLLVRLGLSGPYSGTWG